MSNVIPLGKAAKKVVEELGIRLVPEPEKPANVHLMSQLRASVARLADCQQEQMDDAGWKAFCEANVIKGRNKITEGLELIRKGAGPDAAIRHLRNELAAIDPTFEPREF